MFGLGELDDHADHRRMGFDGSGADHSNAELIADGAGFGVEVVQDFHVIGEEAYGDEDGVGWILFEEIADVGFEPGLRGRAGAALIDELPLVTADGFRDVGAGLFKLLDVGAGVRHR